MNLDFFVVTLLHTVNQELIAPLGTNLVPGKGIERYVLRHPDLVGRQRTKIFCLRIMFQQQLSKLIGHATTQILQNQFNFAVSQLPKVAKWGLPAAVGGILVPRKDSKYIINFVFCI
jgi:hypothetical protein